MGPRGEAAGGARRAGPRSGPRRCGRPCWGRGQRAQHHCAPWRRRSRRRSGRRCGAVRAFRASGRSRSRRVRGPRCSPWSHSVARCSAWRRPRRTAPGCGPRLFPATRRPRAERGSPRAAPTTRALLCAGCADRAGAAAPWRCLGAAGGTAPRASLQRRVVAAGHRQEAAAAARGGALARALRRAGAAPRSVAGGPEALMRAPRSSMAARRGRAAHGPALLQRARRRRAP